MLRSGAYVIAIRFKWAVKMSMASKQNVQCYNSVFIMFVFEYFEHVFVEKVIENSKHS